MEATIGLGFRVILGDNGRENGNYYSILRLYIGIMEKKMETTIV